MNFTHRCKPLYTICTLWVPGTGLYPSKFQNFGYRLVPGIEKILEVGYCWVPGTEEILEVVGTDS